jgi:hypothetical protein
LYISVYSCYQTAIKAPSILKERGHIIAFVLIVPLWPVFLLAKLLQD